MTTADQPTPRRSSVRAFRAALDQVLLRSGRRCAVCYAEGDREVKPGSVAQLRHAGGRPGGSPDNLVFLCANHHAAFDRGGDGPTLTPERVEAARDALYAHLEGVPAHDAHGRAEVVVVANGENATAAAEVAALVQSAGATPAVLGGEQAWGRTLLESVRPPHEARYAVVLLPGRPPASADEALPGEVPANILLELGFLVGRLGPNRVCALHAPATRPPQDVLGILYVPLDAGGEWRRTVVRELRDAGVRGTPP